ncbi:AAA family ATPase [Chloroflexi bacterium TSY]|nr:AAA family ATPase [Chloroflexi bacterium TSY]
MPPDDETERLYQQILARQEIPLPVQNLALVTSNPKDAAQDSPSEDRGWQIPTQPVSNSKDAARTIDRVENSLSSSRLNAMRIVTILCVGLGESFEKSWITAPEAATQTLQQLLSELTEIVQQFGAHVERLGNDGLIALFGATQMYEDDPQRAARSALEIQTAASQFGWQATIGINTGHIYLQRVDIRAARDIAVGPVVNQAIRLQMMAGPGETLIGKRTERFLQDTFVLTPQSVSSEFPPQDADRYRLERLRRQLKRFFGERDDRGRRQPSQLIGREMELAQIAQVLPMLQQQEGHLITIVGEAGIGKSRLIFELRQFLQQNHRSEEQSQQSFASDVLCLEGRCLPLGMSASYWPVIDMLQAYLSLYQAKVLSLSSISDLVHPLQHLLTQLVSTNALTVMQCEDIGPLLGNLLAVQFGTDWDHRLQNAGPEQIRHQTLLALRDLFVALAHNQPMVLIFEDLHWADALSLDLVSLLMEVLDCTPILLVCAYRPETDAQNSASRTTRLETLALRKCADRHTPLHLRGLTAAQSRAMIGSLLPEGDPSDRLVDLVQAKGQGNPLFVEELIHALIESKVVYYEDQKWLVAGEIERLVLPDTVQMIVLGRVDRLPPETGNLLRLAAVIGRIFYRRVLAKVMPDAEFLEQGLNQLETEEFIYLERSIPEEEYSFKHILVQEAIYNSLPQSARDRLHLQVACAFEAIYADQLEEIYEQLAYHYNRSQQVDKAIIYQLAAGNKSRRAYLNDEAIAAFQTALQQITQLAQDRQAEQYSLADWRFDALAGLGQVTLGIGELAAAEDYLRQAIALGKSQSYTKERLIPLYQALGEALDWRGKYSARVQIGEEGLTLLGEEIESVEGAMMNSTIGWGYRACNESEKARYHLLRNTQFIEHLPYSEELGSAYVHIVVAYVQYEQDIEKALAWAKILERKARQHHDLRALANIHQFVGSDIYWETGDLQSAIVELQKAADLFAKIGDLKQTGLSHYRLGTIAFSLGDLEQAKLYLLRVDEMAESLGSIHYLPWMYQTLAITYVCCKEWQKARETYQKSIDFVQEIELGVVEARSTYGLARLYQIQGRSEEATQTLHQALELFLLHMTFHIYWLPEFLHTLEELTPKRTTFHKICARIQSNLAVEQHLSNWYLEPVAEMSTISEPSMTFDQATPGETATQIANGLWTWHDHFGDCAYDLEKGLTIYAANERYLWYVNQSAPRFMCQAEGDLVVQTRCVSASPEMPAIGGLLLWLDAQNYLLLNYGQVGEFSLGFGGLIDGQDLLVGRGRLPGTEFYLQLTRKKESVQAFCSADNQTWFTLGKTRFPLKGSIEVGLVALGDVDRHFYPDAHVEGAAIRFLEFAIL